MAVKVFTELGLALSTLDGSARTMPIAQRPRFAMRLRELRVINAVNLGVNILRLGNFDKALTTIEQAKVMAVAEAMDDIASECDVRMAEVHALRGDPATALALLLPAQKAMEACSHHWGLANLFLLRAQCQSEQGEHALALASTVLAGEAARRANARHISLRIEHEAAVIAEKLGDLAQALQCMKCAARLQAEIDQETKSRLLHELGELALLTASTSKT
jgi:hypothetical protein